MGNQMLSTIPSTDGIGTRYKSSTTRAPHFRRDVQELTGDISNDVFKHGGVSIAVGNASSDVEDAARFVTSSNKEEGFVLAWDALSFELGSLEGCREKQVY
jgi:hypothetical protein